MMPRKLKNTECEKHESKEKREGSRSPGDSPEGKRSQKTTREPGRLSPGAFGEPSKSSEGIDGIGIHLCNGSNAIM